ncbi:MAG: DUF5011 domain-containing protein, partial [Clostridia bacterium]
CTKNGPLTESNAHTESFNNNSSAESSGTELTSDLSKPVLSIKSSERTVSIMQGDNYDLLSGVLGSDDFDGDITNKIQLNKGGFDSGIPGVYMITYFLADAAGNSANPITRTIIVRDTTVFLAPPVFADTIKDEILNPKNPDLFGGAWYHKVVSSRDKWNGIEATITLPEVKISRYEGSNNPDLNFDPAAKNLDNPSVYLGGNATNESDVGLSFSRALIDIKGQTLSKGGIAFRPFWRYITAENQDVGDYNAHNGEYAVSANKDNCIANYHWRYTEYYYLPGDKLRMIIYIPEPNKMQLQIEVIEKSTLPDSIEMRERYGWKDPANFKSPIFHSPGHGMGIDSEYKRVNAIDQVANEGGTAHSSQSEIKNAIWHDTYLYRTIDGKMYRVPMIDSRRGVLDAPDQTRFTVSHEGVDRNLGGEVITIHPGYERA